MSQPMGELARLSGRIVAVGLRAYLDGLLVAERLVRSALAPAGETPVGSGDAPPGRAQNLLESPEAVLARLLERGLEQRASEAGNEFYARLLHELVPDEARILAALAEGPSAALVHVDCRTGRGERRRLLENACAIGRTAAVSMPQMTPSYVRHLLALGLVEIGPAASELKLEYETLIADRTVRAAMKQADSGPVPARAVRRTLRLSALGRDVWERCTSLGTSG